MFGLSVDTLRDIKETFSTLPQIDKVLLYGSRAKGNYRSGSDIDISLIGKNLTPSNAIYPLQDKLDALYLAYQFDISIFEQLDNSALIKDILDTGQVFYQKEKDLPKDWAVKPLGKVCEVIAGQSPEGKYYNSEKNGLPFYQGKKEFQDKYIGKPKKWTIKITKEAKKNDVLMSVRAPVGSINFATQKICIGRGLAAIRVKQLLDKDFLFNFLTSQNNQNLIIGNVGAVFNSINKQQIEDIKIPIPPPATQQKIVAVLDKTFKQIDKAITNTKQNLQNTQDLFNSSLEQVFNNPDDDWIIQALKGVCKIIGGGTPSKEKDEFYNGNILWATVRDMKLDEINNTEHRITQDAIKSSSTNIIPKNNVVIATRVGLGKICLINHDTAINQDLKGIIPISDKQLEVKFLFRWFQNIADKIIEQGTGATVQGVKLDFVKKLLIPIPPLTTQQKIVKKLDALSTQTQALKQSYTQKLESLQTLKKSLLEKAFNGELV